MASHVDRKRLWGRSGSRCAMCNVELTQVNGVDSIVGDEAHIRSRSDAGPRFDANYPTDQLDGYANLVLLCKIHHKLVDDNAAVFPADLLVAMKRRHELRVTEALNAKKDAWLHPAELSLVGDGTQLMAMVGSAAAYSLGNDHPETDEEREAIGSFLQSVQDWGDISGEIGAAGRVDAAAHLHEQLVLLQRLGYIVLAGVGDYRLLPDFVVPAVAVRIVRAEA